MVKYFFKEIQDETRKMNNEINNNNYIKALYHSEEVLNYIIEQDNNAWQEFPLIPSIKRYRAKKTAEKKCLL
ncbi:MAG: hypothetical protein KJ906_02995 [Nanoarchaeota archaeon]|nr:hypothetical protein [Nanoarchaeota archaeon]